MEKRNGNNFFTNINKKNYDFKNVKQYITKKSAFIWNKKQNHYLKLQHCLVVYGYLREIEYKIIITLPITVQNVIHDYCRPIDIC